VTVLPREIFRSGKVGRVTSAFSLAHYQGARRVPEHAAEHDPRSRV